VGRDSVGRCIPKGNAKEPLNKKPAQPDGAIDFFKTRLADFFR
jgi:hypothetical protein